jgi:hypothetical protein
MRIDGIGRNGKPREETLKSALNNARTVRAQDQ